MTVFRANLWRLLALLSFCLVSTVFSQTPDSFDPAAGGPVYGLAAQTDGKVVLGGSFPSVGTYTRFFIARVGADGSVDTTFNPGAGGSSPNVYALAVQTDGKLVVGGSFTTLASQSCNRIGRLNSDGTFDTAYSPGADGDVFCLAVQPDGSILVGGDFLNLMGQSRSYIGRLNTNGTLDATFTPAPSSNTPGSPVPGVYSLALQADGKVVLGGWFTNFSGQARSNLGRLTSSGALDGSFTPAANGSVNVVAVQADGKILVGGSFTALGGQARTNLGRLLSNGTLNAGFSAAANGPVYSLAVQADGRILVGGSFTSLSGQSSTNLGRLNANGTADASFVSSANGAVNSLGVQPDGKVLVGGYYGSLGGQTRSCLGRLSNTYPATQTLTSDGSNVTWLRGYAGPEVGFTTFDLSTNATWYSLGAGTRISGGWQLTGVTVPTNATVRARGYVAGGDHNGSSWYVETSLHYVLPPAIVANDGNFGIRTNRFGFDVSGGPGQLIIEGSTDLVFWTALTTNKITAATFYFSDAGWTNFTRRFYRARWQ